MTTRSAFLFLALTACTHPAPPPDEAVHAKPGAPAEVTAKIEGNRAQVTVSFSQPGTDVFVSVTGLDGLAIKGEVTPLSGATIKDREVKVFDVDFTPAATGRSNLLVSVKGNFRGGASASVATFAVGAPTPAQLQGAGTVMTGDDGVPVKVMQVPAP
jgi:hypothetical protein